MVSLSRPVLRTRSIASLTVISENTLINSDVITLPTLFAGYFRNLFISLRVCGDAARRTLVTTLAGSSSSISTVSSIKSSSTSFDISESVIEVIIVSCALGSSSANISAAVSFLNNRNTFGNIAGSTYSRYSAASMAFISSSAFIKSTSLFCARSSESSKKVILSPP